MCRYLNVQPWFLWSHLLDALQGIITHGNNGIVGINRRVDQRRDGGGWFENPAHLDTIDVTSRTDSCTECIASGYHLRG
mgnify:CR=1 FL=1